MMNVTSDSRMHRPRQSGVALVVALIILIVVTLIAMAALKTSTMELRMARNEEADTNTFQTAMAAIDFVISDETNLPATGPLLVPVDVALPDDPGVSHEPFDVTAGDAIVATAARLRDCVPPPRARQGSSLIGFSAFHYDIAADVNKNESGMGRSAMSQGYTLLGPKC
jgi:hypothetical protein